jgi:hypothetical protein
MSAPAATCAEHRDEPVTGACARCGRFICAKCASTALQNCAACAARLASTPERARRFLLWKVAGELPLHSVGVYLGWLGFNAPLGWTRQFGLGLFVAEVAAFVAAGLATAGLLQRRDDILQWLLAQSLITSCGIVAAGPCAAIFLGRGVEGGLWARATACVALAAIHLMVCFAAIRTAKER